jgi:hypothetical protein
MYSWLKTNMQAFNLESLFLCHDLGWGNISFYTVMRRLTMGIRSEKCVVRRFHHCANFIECTDTNVVSIAYYTPSLYGITYCC